MLESAQSFPCVTFLCIKQTILCIMAGDVQLVSNILCGYLDKRVHSKWKAVIIRGFQLSDNDHSEHFEQHPLSSTLLKVQVHQTVFL